MQIWEKSMKNLILYNNTFENGSKEIIELDLSNCKNDKDIFDIFKVDFQFPEWFGENWNAFHDCITNLCFDVEGLLVIKIRGLKNIFSYSEESAKYIIEDLLALENGEATQNNGKTINALVYVEFCEELIHVIYECDKLLSDEQKKTFGEFTIEILKTFPNFKYDEELELAYILAGEFVDYMQDLVGVNEIELDKALKYIEKLHKDKHQCIKELATIGFVENIQNTWSEDNKKIIYPKLGTKTKKSWDDLNKFWEGK